MTEPELTNSQSGKILIVDDEQIVHLTLKRLLEPDGYTIDSAYGGKEALDKFTHCGLEDAKSKIPARQSPSLQAMAGGENPQSKYDLIVLDIRMPDMDSIQVLREIRKRELDIEVLILTGYTTIESATQAMNYGARGYIMKPIENVPEFRVKVQDAVHIARLVRNNKRLYGAILSADVDSLTIDGKSYEVPVLREENKEIFQRLMEVIRDAVVFLDFDGNITFANVNFAQMLGESYQNLLGARFDSYVVEEDYDKTIEAFTRLSNGEVAVSTPAQLKTNIGSPRSVIVSASPIYHQMEYRGVAMVISDITEIETVRKKVELLANLVENAQYDMMFIVNPEGQIMECNSLANRTFAYSRSEMLGLNMAALFKKKADEGWEKIADSVNQALRWRGELTAVSRDGKEFPAQITASRSVEEVNKNGNMICFIRDVTREKEIDRMKSEFISVVGHELRTPLTSIKNAVHIVLGEKAGAINENQRRFLSMADRNINRLTGIVNDLLDISRIESGRIKVELSPLDLGAPLDMAIASLTSRAKEKSISIHKEIPSDVSQAYGNSDKLEQIFVNLLDNAIKFTPEGGHI